jgi:hypothetical protein
VSKRVERLGSHLLSVVVARVIRSCRALNGASPDRGRQPRRVVDTSSQICYLGSCDESNSIGLLVDALRWRSSLTS